MSCKHPPLVLLVRDHLKCRLCFICQATAYTVVEDSRFPACVLNTVGNPTLLCIVGGQLLINLKEAGERGAVGGTDFTLRTLSDVTFGEVRGLL